MCTAISKGRVFGRTLDVARSYGEEIVFAPRRYRPGARNAVLGIGLIREGVPLFFDAVNESGLAAAGLNFPEYAVYHPPIEGKRNIASFELIDIVLSECKNLTEAVSLLKKCNITPDSVSPDLPATPMHWMIADREGSVALEPTAGGLIIYDNPFGVLTNSPPFPVHRDNVMLNQKLTPSSAAHLPGDWSSSSRFLRALFVKKYTADSGVSDYFHIMDTVAVPKGCGQKGWYTVYTSCADLESGDYYFTTYEDGSIRKIALSEQDLGGDELLAFPMM